MSDAAKDLCSARRWRPDWVEARGRRLICRNLVGHPGLHQDGPWAWEQGPYGAINGLIAALTVAAFNERRRLTNSGGT